MVGYNGDMYCGAMNEDDTEYQILRYTAKGHKVIYERCEVHDLQHFARGLRSAHAVLRRDGGIFTVGGADTGLRPESEDHGDDYEQEIGLHAASFRLTRGFPAFFLSGFHKF